MVKYPYMRGLARFLSYHNAVPITVALVLLGAASTYAANNPELILAEEQDVLSIDNTYIANVDLTEYTPIIRITDVREDEERYYITYELTTIALVDHVWQDVTVTEVLEVAQRTIGTERDLGMYVTKQLNEKLQAEQKRLRETQAFERQQVSNKRVATRYRGIVGGLLSDEVTTIEDYEPVVRPPRPTPEQETFARPPAEPPAPPRAAEAPEDRPAPPERELLPVAEPDSAPTSTATSSPAEGASQESEDDSADDDASGDGEDHQPSSSNQPPVLTVLGENPVQIAIGEAYVDLGAVVTDDWDNNLAVDVLVDGVVVTAVTLDTSATTTYSITYRTVDSSQATTTATRLVMVYDPTAPSPEQSDTGNTTNATGTALSEETATGTDPVPESEPESESESTPDSDHGSTTEPAAPNPSPNQVVADPEPATTTTPDAEPAANDSTAENTTEPAPEPEPTPRPESKPQPTSEPEPGTEPTPTEPPTSSNPPSEQ